MIVDTCPDLLHLKATVTEMLDNTAVIHAGIVCTVWGRKTSVITKGVEINCTLSPCKEGHRFAF